jgi:hypothetical protein
MFRDGDALHAANEATDRDVEARRKLTLTCWLERPSFERRRDFDKASFGMFFPGVAM